MKENNKISDNPSFYATGVDIEGLSEDEIIVAVSNCTKKQKKEVGLVAIPNIKNKTATIKKNLGANVINKVILRKYVITNMIYRSIINL